MLPNQRPLQDPAELRRIKSLAVPPAYENVWICPLAEGYLQATGRDAAGRKQYRYHEAYRAWRQAQKYDTLVGFGEALASLRRQVNRDLRRPGLHRRRVLAAAVRLMDLTLIRVGHGGETDGKPTYGLATLREKHLDLHGSQLRLTFRGKSGRRQQREVDAPALAKVLRRCRGLPGEELFTYLDEDDQPRSIDAGDVNAYLAEHAGPDITAKSFRTWGGTVLAACRLAATEREGDTTRRDRQVVAVIKDVAAALGNRPATCRKYYVHPAVLQGFERGELTKRFREVGQLRPRPARTQLNRVEQVVLDLLRDAG
jgi:DNA topoisomerase-1